MTGARDTNVVVLLCDQLQRDAISPYGGPVQTPTFERLAGEGLAFDRYYCATPLCVPTRPSMMNGRWPHAHGAVCFGERHQYIEAGSELLIDRLHDAGYHVGYEGIWHIRRRAEDDRTGEYAYFSRGGFPYEEHGQALVEQGKAREAHRTEVQAPTEEGIVTHNISIPVPAAWTKPMEDHPDMHRAQRVVEFIRRAPDERPIAVWCSVAGPHPPLLVPEKFMRMFDPAEIEPPPGFDEDPSALPRPVREAPGALGTRDWGWEPWAEAIAAYYGYVAFVDHCQGMVLDALEDADRLDNSIVIASCDHGEMLGAHGIYQKMVLYERAIRLPFIIRAPGLGEGRRGQLASQTDMAPTVLDLLDMAPLGRAQGESLRPVLQSAGANWRDHTFSEYNGWVDGGFKMRAAIGRRYKYVYHHEAQDQLFDLEADPEELANLIGDAGERNVVDRLRSILASWMRETGDSLEPQWDGR